MRKADNLPPSCVVKKSGNLNYVEPSGHVQACNGTDLPYLLLLAASFLPVSMLLLGTARLPLEGFS